MWLVYRLLYTTEIGPIPDDMTLDHVVCQNGWCCNPAHCEPVTNRENVRRALAARYAGRTACPKGHPYDLYRRTRKSGASKGKSYCVKCGTLRANAWTREKRKNTSALESSWPRVGLSRVRKLPYLLASCSVHVVAHVFADTSH